MCLNIYSVKSCVSLFIQRAVCFCLFVLRIRVCICYLWCLKKNIIKLLQHILIHFSVQIFIHTFLYAMFVLGLKQWYWNRDQCVCILVFIHSYRIIWQDGEWNWFHNCHVLLTLLYAILCHVINRNTLCASIDINTPCAVTDTDTAFEWPAYTPCYMSGLSNNTAWRWKHAVAYRTPDFEDNGAGLASWSSHRLWVQISALVQLLKWFVDRVSSDFACRCQWNGQTAHSVLPDWLQLWLRWWWWSALGRAVRMVTLQSDGFGSCSENGDCTLRRLWVVRWEWWLRTVRRFWVVQWDWWLCSQMALGRAVGMVTLHNQTALGHAVRMLSLHSQTALVRAVRIVTLHSQAALVRAVRMVTLHNQMALGCAMRTVT